MAWEDIIADERFQPLPQETKEKMADIYFQDKFAPDPRYQSATPEFQKKIYDTHMKTVAPPSPGLIKSAIGGIGESLAGTARGIAKFTPEAISEPLTAAAEALTPTSPEWQPQTIPEKLAAGVAGAGADIASLYVPVGAGVKALGLAEKIGRIPSLIKVAEKFPGVAATLQHLPEMAATFAGAGAVKAPTIEDIPKEVTKGALTSIPFTAGMLPASRLARAGIGGLVTGGAGAIEAGIEGKPISVEDTALNTAIGTILGFLPGEKLKFEITKEIKANPDKDIEDLPIVKAAKEGGPEYTPPTVSSEEAAQYEAEGKAFTEKVGVEPSVPTVEDLATQPQNKPSVPIEEAARQEAIKPEEKLNSITRKEVGDMIVAGDPAVLQHIAEGVQEKGRAQVEDAVRNEALSRIVQTPKGPERDAVKKTIANMETGINEALTHPEKVAAEEPVKKAEGIAETFIIKGITPEELAKADADPSYAPQEQEIGKITASTESEAYKTLKEGVAKGIYPIGADLAMEKSAKEPVKTVSFSEGANVKVGKSPQLYTIIKEEPFDPKTDQPGERFYTVKNNKTGETSIVPIEDLKKIKSKNINLGSGFGALQDSYESLAAITKDKIQEAFPHLREVGDSIYKTGMKYTEFAKQMKGVLGELWEKFKSLMIKTYQSVKSKIQEERGSISGKPIEESKPFYSQIEKIIEDKVQSTPDKKIDADTFKGLLSTTGIKQDELTNTKIKDFLEGKKAINEKISKNDVLDYLKEQRTELKDVVLGDETGGRDNEGERDRLAGLVDGKEIFAAGSIENEGRHDLKLVSDDGLYQWVDAEDNDIELPPRKTIEKAQEDFEATYIKGGNWEPIGSWWTTPEEVAPIRTAKEAPKFSQYQEPGGTNYREMFVTTPEITPSMTLGDWLSKKGMKESYNNSTKIQKEAYADQYSREQGNWQDGHSPYSDIRNPVVRIRFNERTDGAGRKILFIEEMQGPSKENAAKMPEWLQKRQYDIGVKRALKYAADNGFDGVSWTPGEVQADRYDLSKRVSKIYYERKSPELSSRAMEAGEPLYTISVFDKNSNNILEEANLTRGQLEDRVGKEVAAKMERGEGEGAELTSPAGGKIKTKALSGLDLKVGGEGLKSLYDKILPKKFQEITKERVGEVELFDREGKDNGGFPSFMSALFVPIPKEAVKGFALYSNPMFDPILIYRELKGLSGNIKEAMPHLERLGQRVYSEGARTYKDFATQMKAHLKDLWNSFKNVMLKVYQSAKSKIQEERGSFSTKPIEEAKLPSPAERIKEQYNTTTEPIKNISQGIKTLVMASTKSPEHLRAAEIASQHLIGGVERNVQGIKARFAEAKDFFNKELATPEGRQRNIDLMEAIDKGKPTDNPYAPQIKEMLAENRKAIGEMAPDKAKWLDEDYFPRLVEQKDVPALMEYLSKRPLGGKKGFLKERKFEDIKELEEAGFKLKTYNPIEILEEHNLAVQRFLGWERAKKEYINRGDIINVNNSGVPLSKNLKETGEKVPYNSMEWAKLDDKFSTIWTINPETRLPERIGFRVAKKPVADILNNYLSKGLSGNENVGTLYRGYMGVSNALNQAQLGVGSAFHAGFTTAETFFSGMANNIKDVYRFARGKESLDNVAKGLIETVKAPVYNPFVKGEAILQEYLKPGTSTNPEIMNIAKAVEIAGGRAYMEAPLQTHQYEAMMKDWYTGDKLKAAMRSPVAFSELTAKPILQYLVPRQKMAVFGELVDRIMRNNPGKSLEDLRPELRQAWNRTDARLGQVVYERLFSNNAAKNVVQGLVRAPGWSGGTIAEIGGAFKDTINFVRDWQRTGKLPEEIPDRVAYTLSLLIGAATINGALTYMFTGEQPKDMDYWAFRTGEKDERGRPERMLLPTYAKDVFAYYQNPSKTLLAKAHPMISMIGDMLIRNKDYYGTEIRHPGDNPLYQASDFAKYGIKQFVPFWIRGEAKIAEAGGGFAKTWEEHPGKLIAPEFGVMPASSEYTKTHAEKVVDEIYQRRPMSTKTKQEFEKQNIVREFIRRLRAKDPTVMKDVTQKIKEGILTPEDRNKIVKSRNMTPLQSEIRHLTAEQVIEVWDVSTPKEQTEIKRDVIAKIMRSRTLTSEEKRNYLKHIKRELGIHHYTNEELHAIARGG